MTKTILNKLLRMGFDVLSKHDAFLIPTQQYKKANELIEYELNEVFGVGKYKLSKQPL